MNRNTSQLSAMHFIKEFVMLKGLFTSLATSLQTTADGIDTLANKDKKDIVKVIRAQVDSTIDNATQLINNSLKEENRQKVAKDATSAVSNVFKVSGMFVGKIANNTLKIAQEGFNSEFNK
ncbi:MAG: hypothetical protein M0R17_05260 [Candidatus Omnitrophica bacterium]|jgi:hypothetical protein|nr:hypothetical protein [Candidatus Omnitrophota bacterium]